MDKYIIAFDLGTGGIKSSLYDTDGNCIESETISYNTYYPKVGWYEQKPEEWWDAFKKCTQKLIHTSGIDSKGVDCLAISGHSLGVVPVDKGGNLLRSHTPIWSDTRAKRQANVFFSKVDSEEWYAITGNGFSQECYSVFKIMWYRDKEPDMFARIHKVIGTKDYLNLKLTGKILTDNSYASGSGIYDLQKRQYDDKLIDESGLSAEIFPDIVPSTHIVGTVLPEIAKEIGLQSSVKVVCGGVDNSCMALGAGNISAGKAYLSLGTSAWIAISSEKPLIDKTIKPFVFDHVVPNLYTSATSIFSAGNSLKWLRDTVCKELIHEANKKGVNVYDLMLDNAKHSSIGANKLMFNPSLAGGSAANISSNIRGAFLGLDLSHTQNDLIRATLEGIAIDLSLMYKRLKEICELDDKVLIVGGGSRNQFWRQIFADVFNTKIIKANVDQDAGSLGAAAVALVGAGLWPDFSKIKEIIKTTDIAEPLPENSKKYNKIISIFESILTGLADISERYEQLEL